MKYTIYEGDEEIYSSEKDKLSTEANVRAAALSFTTLNENTRIPLSRLGIEGKPSYVKIKFSKVKDDVIEVITQEGRNFRIEFDNLEELL